MATGIIERCLQGDANLCRLIVDTLQNGETNSFDTKKIEISVCKLMCMIKEYNQLDFSNNNNLIYTSGTGFVVKKNGNKLYIVTAFHCISNATNIVATFKTNDTIIQMQCDIVGGNVDLDVGLLMCTMDTENTLISNLNIGNSDTLVENKNVSAVGYGDQDTISITSGIVSHIGMNIFMESRVQSDVSINPGCSGGPLMHGDNVVAIIVATRPNKNGISYFTPINEAMHALNNLIKENGERKFTLPYAYFTKSLNMKITNKKQISYVHHALTDYFDVDSILDEISIKYTTEKFFEDNFKDAHYTIYDNLEVKMNDEKSTNYLWLMNRINDGDTVILKLKNNGNNNDVTMSNLCESLSMYREYHIWNKGYLFVDIFGIQFSTFHTGIWIRNPPCVLSKEETSRSYVIVTNVPNNTMEENKLKVGDIITHVQEIQINDLFDFYVLCYQQDDEILLKTYDNEYKYIMNSKIVSSNNKKRMALLRYGQRHDGVMKIQGIEVSHKNHVLKKFYDKIQQYTTTQPTKTQANLEAEEEEAKRIAEEAEAKRKEEETGTEKSSVPAEESVQAESVQAATAASTATAAEEAEVAKAKKGEKTRAESGLIEHMSMLQSRITEQDNQILEANTKINAMTEMLSAVNERAENLQLDLDAEKSRTNAMTTQIKAEQMRAEQAKHTLHTYDDTEKLDGFRGLQEDSSDHEYHTYPKPVDPQHYQGVHASSESNMSSLLP